MKPSTPSRIKATISSTTSAMAINIWPPTFSLLLMLAFAIDQIQAHCCAFFQQALRAQHTKTYLWEKMRAAFTLLYIRDWEQFFTTLIDGPTICDIIPDTS